MSSRILSPLVFPYIRTKQREKWKKLVTKTNITSTLMNTKECYKQGKDWTVLHLVCKYDPTVENLRYLINLGADWTPLHYLCQKNASREIIEYMIQQGAKLNEPDVKPLDNILTISKKAEAVKLLIKYGADPNKTNEFGNNSLHTLAKSKLKKKLVQILIESGCDINAPTLTPLHILCMRNGNIKDLELLIKHGANTNALTKDKKNAGHLLVKHLSTQIDLTDHLKLLMKYGLNGNQVDSNKKIKDYLTYWGSKTPSNIQDVLFKLTSPIVEEFKQLFERKELTDSTLKDIPIHKLLVEFRTGQTIEKLEEIFKEDSQEDINSFLKFIYFNLVENENKIRKICYKIGIKNYQNKNLQYDLQKLYKCDQTKNFIIKTESKKEIKIHKFLLLARSELFRGMFLSIIEDQKFVTDFSNRSPITIRTWVKFLYLDYLDLETEEEIKNKNLILDELDDAIDYYQFHKKTRLIHELAELEKKK
ncbi:ankyrin repeat [Anaeramoeba flamelloides]|uniref:Ankyrin repeat n=1 Tax=Anaeramoeba flamelloides TaxID=1746091 RepID=A0ABQ8X9U5_9EUKA|nr:ankyrin repeat [Anaeramoeba flamelloides]